MVRTLFVLDMRNMSFHNTLISLISVIIWPYIVFFSQVKFLWNYSQQRHQKQSQISKHYLWRAFFLLAASIVLNPDLFCKVYILNFIPLLLTPYFFVGGADQNAPRSDLAPIPLEYRSYSWWSNNFLFLPISYVISLLILHTEFLMHHAWCRWLAQAIQTARLRNFLFKSETTGILWLIPNNKRQKDHKYAVICLVTRIFHSITNQTHFISVIIKFLIK